MTRSNRTIPPRSDGRIVQAATRTALTVPAGDCTVVYYWDDLSVTLSVAPGQLDTTDLNTAINTQQLPGRPVVSAEPRCGGRVTRDDLDIAPHSTDHDRVVEAIPHFYYADMREPDQLAALRVIYRALTTNASVNTPSAEDPTPQTA